MKAYALLIVMGMLIVLGVLGTVAYARVAEAHVHRRGDDERVELLTLARSAAAQGKSGTVNVRDARGSIKVSTSNKNGDVHAVAAGAAGTAVVDAKLSPQGAVSWRERFDRVR